MAEQFAELNRNNIISNRFKTVRYTNTSAISFSATEAKSIQITPPSGTDITGYQPIGITGYFTGSYGICACGVLTANVTASSPHVQMVLKNVLSSAYTVNATAAYADVLFEKV